jgi:hypothetical protein
MMRIARRVGSRDETTRLACSSSIAGTARGRRMAGFCEQLLLFLIDLAVRIQPLEAKAAILPVVCEVPAKLSNLQFITHY